MFIGYFAMLPPFAVLVPVLYVLNEVVICTELELEKYVVYDLPTTGLSFVTGVLSDLVNVKLLLWFSP